MIYKPQAKIELKRLCDDESIHLGLIDTSLIGDMSGLFRDSKREDFSGIESWDTGKVRDMSHMFANARAFSAPIDSWNVANVVYMTSMFEGATAFNQPLSSWNVSNVVDMSYMFANAKSFNQSIAMWDIWLDNRDIMRRCCSNIHTIYDKHEVYIDTSEFVTNICGMFRGATSFDFGRNLNEHHWDIDYY